MAIKKQNETANSIDISSVVKLVRMVRQGGGVPKEADVHPDEVSNYQAGGWSIAPPPEE